MASKEIEELEQEAVRLHGVARDYNLAGRFRDAEATYRQMYDIEDEALRLTAAASRATASQAPCDTENDGDFPFLALAPWSNEEVRKRAAGAILGAIVGDAAAMGVHWIYNPQDLQHLLHQVQEKRQKEKQNELSTPSSLSINEDTRPSTTIKEDEDIGLEFYNPPQSPYFQYPNGRSSPYGEQTLVLLTSLAKQGGLHPSKYAQALIDKFGIGWNGYRDASLKGFLRNWYRGSRPPHFGAHDWQANCFTRLPPLVALYAGDTAKLMQAVEFATRVTQNHDAAVAWARVSARFLELLILGQQGQRQQQQQQEKERERKEKKKMKEAQQQEERKEREKENRKIAQQQQEEEEIDEKQKARMTPAEALKIVLEELGESESQLAQGAENYEELNEEIRHYLQHMLSLVPSKTVPQAIVQLGKNCHLPASLQTPLYVILRTLYEVDDEGGGGRDGDREEGEAQRVYVKAIRAAVREGGCSASRAGFVGACLGAYYGYDDANDEEEVEETEGSVRLLPLAWTKQVLGFEKMKEVVEELLRHRDM